MKSLPVFAFAAAYMLSFSAFAGEIDLPVLPAPVQNENLTVNDPDKTVLMPASIPDSAQNTAPSDAPDQPNAGESRGNVSVPDVNSAEPLKTPPSLLETALSAAPPMRASYAPALAQPENLPLIDEWIEKTSVDAPQNLLLKDILTAMPPHIAGPRIVKLAEKSADPQLRDSWARWLKKYPDAYARVLVSWLRAESTNPPRFNILLGEYAAVRPADALNIWIQLIIGYPSADLGVIAEFGRKRPGCASAAASALTAQTEELPRLRVIRALSQCADASSVADDLRISLIPPVSELLAAKAPSRRIAALDLIRAVRFRSAELDAAVESIYDHAKNTTERAHALSALEIAGPSPRQNERIRSALVDGDEALRYAASELIAARTDAVARDSVLDAFKRELWPDTQLNLYTVLCSSGSPDTIRAFRRDIILDAGRAPAMRMAALADFSRTAPGALSFDDMARLQNEHEPQLDIIAAYAEALYEHNPAARPGLRSWLHLQQPFERRLFAAFSHFVRVDARTGDASAADTMRAVCAVDDPQEAIIKPCLDFFRQHAETEADKKTLEKLEQRKNQIDAMLNFEL